MYAFRNGSLGRNGSFTEGVACSLRSIGANQRANSILGRRIAGRPLEVLDGSWRHGHHSRRTADVAATAAAAAVAGRSCRCSIMLGDSSARRYGVYCRGLQQLRQAPFSPHPSRPSISTYISDIDRSRDSSWLADWSQVAHLAK